MSSYIIKEETMVNIANSIRNKIGSSIKMTPEEMSQEIDNMRIDSLLKPSEYPDYIRTEINRVADAVRSVLMTDSIVSICLSDSHYPADENTRLSTLHAMMAIKGLTYLLPIDFIAHLGDVGFEGDSSTTTTVDLLKTNLIEMLNYIKESNDNSIPLFIAIGNHDSGNYITTSDNSDMVGGEYLYNNFTTLSASDNTVFSGESTGGYCYRDFADKKVRVFLLNTSEEIIIGGYSNDNGASQEQLSWFASKLQELNTKSDADKWGIIVLCHYPADYGAARPLSNTIAAYVKGTSITLNGTNYNFSGSNSAKFIVQHHGHIHNFLFDKLYSGSTPTQYEAWRVGIPNSQNNRENYYGEFNGINYSETDNQTKVPGTVEDTSFVVNVINPSEEKLYSFYYGKGYNRTIGYGAVVYYSITTSLTNTACSNTEVSIESGLPYSAVISIPDGYSMSELVITMGGVDITTSAYDDGTITIPEVTGNIVITAIASKIPTSNLSRIAYSFEANSTEIYNNGLGYKNNYRLSGSAPTSWESALSGYVLTGCIPWDGSSSINISGATIPESSDGYCRMFMTNDARDYVYSPWISSSDDMRSYFTVEEISTNNYKLTPNFTVNSSITHITLSLKGSGEDLIITFGDNDNSDNTEQYYTITNNLTNVITSNSTSSILENTNYQATLMVNDGYELSSITVVMEGIDITSSVYSDGEINIDTITGNVVITAIATIIQTSGYTNQIPLSTTTINGTEIFNAPYGYKTDTRINSSNAEVAISGMCCTGYISLNSDGNSAGQIIRIKNITVSGSATPYLILYNSNGIVSSSISTDGLTNGGTTGNNGNGFTVSSIEDGIITVVVNVNSMYAIRLSCGVIDDTTIITIDEPIE